MRENLGYAIHHRHLYRLVRIGMFSILTIHFFGCQLGGAGEGSDDIFGDGGALSFSALRLSLLSPNVDAKTPAALKNTTTAIDALSRVMEDACSPADFPGDDANDPSSDLAKCRALDEVRGRFFSAGPTTLADVATATDGRIEEFFGDPSRYIPCLDESNTTGGSLGDTSYDAYAATDYNLDATFPNGDSFAPGVSYTLSCIRELDESSWVAVGRKDDVTYIYDGQLTGPSRLSAVDADGNIELWYIVRQLDADFDGTTDVEKFGPNNIADQVDLTYLGSTALIHAKLDATTSQIELTATGAGVGDGCSMHLQTRGSHLYYKANRNRYGHCATTDFTSYGLITYNDANDDGSIDLEDEAFGAEGEFAYSAAMDGVEYCYDVSSGTPVATDLSDCTDAGLGNVEVPDPTDDTGATTTTASSLALQPLARIGGGNTNALGIVGYNVVHLLNEKPTGLADFVAIAPPPDTDVTIEDDSVDALVGAEDEDGEIDLSAFFENDVFFISDSAATTNPWSAGFCRDEADTDNQQSFSIVESLDVSSIGSEVSAAIGASPALGIKVNVNNSIGERSTGTLGWSAFSGANLSVQADGQAVAGVSTVSIDAQDPDVDAGATGIQEVVTPLPDGFDISAIDDLTLTLSGTQSYACDENAGALEPVSRRPALGNARLVYFTPAADDDADSQ